MAVRRGLFRGISRHHVTRCLVPRRRGRRGRKGARAMRRPTILIVVGGVFLVLGLAALAPAAPAPAAATPGPDSPPAPRLRFPAGRTSVRVPLERGGDLLYVRARVNNSEVYYFLIDTGANGSCVHASLANRLRLPVVGATRVDAAGGTRDMRILQVSSLEVGDVVVENLFLTESELGPTRTRIGTLDTGIIGGDFLGQMPFTLDYEGLALILYDPARFKPPADALEGQLQVAACVATVTANIGGAEGRPFLLDTASEDFLSVHDPEPGQNPALHKELAGRHLIGDAFGCPIAASAWRCDSFTVLGRTFRSVEIISSPPPPSVQAFSGVVGAACLKEFELTFDYAHGRVWVRPAPALSLKDRIGGLDLNKGDFLGITPLHRAAKEGRTEDVRLLLAAGAPINAADARGRTPMMYAALHGRAEAFEALMEAKADAALKDANGGTVLHCAAAGGSPAIVKMLLQLNINPSASDDKGNTPLILGATVGNVEIIEALVAAGADVNAKTKDGATALMVAALEGRVEAVKALLRLKADPLAQKDDGGTALMAAALAGNADIIEGLVTAGADVNAKKKDGATALMFAAQGGHAEAVKALVAAGADVNARTKNGMTALSIAKAAGKADVVAALEKAGAKE